MPNNPITWTKHKINVNIEKLILTGLIVNDEFTREILKIISRDNLKIFNLPYFKIIVPWCIDYYNKFHKCPGKTIQDIFIENLKHLGDEDVELMKEFLSNLSEQYEAEASGFDIQYVLEKAKKYIKLQFYSFYGEKIYKSSLSGNVNECDLIREDFNKTVITSAGDGDILTKFAKPLSDFLETTIETNRFYLKPFLYRGSLILIHGKRGAGKSFFSQSIALSISTELKENKEIEFGSWEAWNKAKVLYVNGDDPPGEILYRLKKLTHRFDLNHEMNAPFEVLSVLQLNQETQTIFNLYHKADRDILTDYVRKNNVDVLILDNLSTLSYGADGNEVTSWSPVNLWLVQLRQFGISVIVIDHEGKDSSKGARGTSAKSDSMDAVLSVSAMNNEEDENQSDCFCEIRFQKRPRTQIEKVDLSPFLFNMRRVDDEENLVWEIKKGRKLDEKKEKKDNIAIKIMVLEGYCNRDIIKEFDLKGDWAIHNVKKDLKNRGYIEDNRYGKITDEGKIYLEKLKKMRDG